MRTKGGAYLLGGLDKAGQPLPVNGVKVKVDPKQEWAQILREVWRIQRDYFYDPNMHGVDWPAMWQRWSAFLPHVNHRADLNLLIAEMIGELATGHQYVWGGQTPPAPQGVPVGLLGADVEPGQGGYVLKRIYRGQNWNPKLRAPLTAPGVDARVGDVIVAVNGRPITAGQSFELGVGGGGIVYECTSDDGEAAVIKGPKTVGVKQPDLEREARLLLSIPQHPNLIRLKGLHRDPRGHTLIILERVYGNPLRALNREVVLERLKASAASS